MEDRDAGGADVLTEKRSFKSNSTLFIPMRKKNVGERRFCAFYKKGCKCVFNVEQGQSWTSLLRLTAKQAKEFNEGNKNVQSDAA